MKKEEEAYCLKRHTCDCGGIIFWSCGNAYAPRFSNFRVVVHALVAQLLSLD